MSLLETLVYKVILWTKIAKYHKKRNIAGLLKPKYKATNQANFGIKRIKSTKMSKIEGKIALLRQLNLMEQTDVQKKAVNGLIAELWETGEGRNALDQYIKEEQEKQEMMQRFNNFNVHQPKQAAFAAQGPAASTSTTTTFKLPSATQPTPQPAPQPILASQPVKKEQPAPRAQTQTPVTQPSSGSSALLLEAVRGGSWADDEQPKEKAGNEQADDGWKTVQPKSKPPRKQAPAWTPTEGGATREQAPHLLPPQPDQQLYQSPEEERESKRRAVHAPPMVGHARIIHTRNCNNINKCENTTHPSNPFCKACFEMWNQEEVEERMCCFPGCDTMVSEDDWMDIQEDYFGDKNDERVLDASYAFSIKQFYCEEHFEEQFILRDRPCSRKRSGCHGTAKCYGNETPVCLNCRDNCRGKVLIGKEEKKCKGKVAFQTDYLPPLYCKNCFEQDICRREFLLCTMCRKNVPGNMEEYKKYSRFPSYCCVGCVEKKRKAKN